MTPEILAALTALIEPGLVAGLGTAAPGGMCIEAAVSLAVHGTFGDTPPCVAAADRGYAMWLNDARWSSPRARAAALLPLAIAQIGTDGTDRAAWVARLADGTIRRVLPVALRAVAIGAAPQLEAAALRCEREGTIAAAAAASAAASAYAGAAYDADADYPGSDSYAAYAAGADAYAAAASAAASAYAAYDADASAGAAYAAAGAAYAAAAYAGDAYDAAYDAAQYDAWGNFAAYDAVLRLSVQVALDAYAAEAL